MDRQLQVGRGRAHLDRQHAFGDQLAGARPDEADAENALGLRIENQLRQAVGAIERDRAARRAPRELRDRRPCGPPSAPAPRSGPHHASSGSVKTTAGIARGSNATFSPAITSTATRPSCDALCASIGSPTTSPIAKIDGSCGAPLLVDDDEAALVDLHAACGRGRESSSSAGGRRTRARDRTAARFGSTPRPRTSTRMPFASGLHLHDLAS